MRYSIDTGPLFSYSIWQRCRVSYLFFHQLLLSMEHHVWVSINAPDWGSINLNQIYTYNPPKFGYSRERWISVY